MDLISPGQCRAARAYLGWSQDQLAKTSTVSLRAIQDFENEKRVPNNPTIMALKYALEMSHVVFTYNPEGCYISESMELQGIGPDPEKMGFGYQIEREIKPNYFGSEKLKQLTDEYSRLNKKYEQLLIRYAAFHFKNADAYEFVHHGFLRRIGTLKRCIQNIYAIYSPDRSDKPSVNERKDLEINLQSFSLNAFGCLDNLAWIWVKEKKLKDKKGEELTGMAVGLMSEKNNKIIRESFSKNFQDYLKGLTKWYAALEDIRHALAHRIPLYIPPYTLTLDESKKYEELENYKLDALKKQNFETYERLNSEQDNLGVFVPCMMHSHKEKSRPIIFHAQVFADWNTIIEIFEKFIDELSSIAR